MAGKPDEAAADGCSQDLRTKRQQARDFAKQGILIPGLKPLSHVSYAFAKSLINMAPATGSSGPTSVEDIEAFFTRAMVPYSRAIAFAVQEDDPDAFRTAMGDGLRRTVGFSDDTMSAKMLLALLGELVDKVEMAAQGLPKPFGMLHRLVMDFVETRRDNPKRKDVTNRELRRRRAELLDREYWNGIAD